MASAKQRGTTWYAKYVGTDGKAVRTATTARTKKECLAFAHELEADAERQRRGLVPLRKPCTTTLGDACDWWLRERCPSDSAKKERSRLQKHVIGHAFGSLLLSEVTPAAVEGRLREMATAEASPASQNRLRAGVHSVFQAAIDAGT